MNGDIKESRRHKLLSEISKGRTRHVLIGTTQAHMFVQQATRKCVILSRWHSWFRHAKCVEILHLTNWPADRYVIAHVNWWWSHDYKVDKVKLIYGIETLFGGSVLKNRTLCTMLRAEEFHTIARMLI